MRRIGIIEAPSVLGLKPSGVEMLPETLLSLGLAARLGATRRGRVEPPSYDPRRDETHGIRNAAAIAAYAADLADAVTLALDAGELPVVLGGDCSILLGPMLALRQRGRFGLLFIDGHADFYQPAANFNGEAASSELAFATGRGPGGLTSLRGYRPLVRDEDVVAFGMRDEAETARYGSRPLPPSIRAFDLERVRRQGIRETALQAVRALGGPPRAGFWIHLDVDVLDDAVMPAVDYRQPGGLSWDELGSVLAGAFQSGAAVGLDVTIFNPRLDPDGGIARALVEFLERTVGRADSASAPAPIA